MQCFIKDRGRPMLSIAAWRRRDALYMSLVVLLYSSPAYPDGCYSNSCLMCTNQPANCTVNNTTQIITCVGDTTTCNVTACGQDDNHVCYGHYSANANLTVFHFSSACPNKDSNYQCSSINPTCMGTGSVANESLLFGNSPGMSVVQCRCNGDNCTANITFQYNILPSMSPYTSPMATSVAEPASRSNPTLITAVIVGVLLICFVLIVVTVAFIVGFCVRRAHSTWSSSPSSSSQGPQTSAFNRRVPTESLLPSFMPSSPTRSSSPSATSAPSVKLIKMIGRGRFSAVWKAELSNRIIAAKVFTYHSRHSWENECQLYSLESTANPFVLQYLGSEVKGVKHEAQMFIFMPLCELGSLSRFLKESPPVTWAQMFRIVQCVVRGVAHLHSECYMNADGKVVQKYSIAHRDIKSSNVLMRSADGDCVVGDLGLALILDPTVDPKQMANSGQVGTFRYMAPEALDARVNLQDLESFKQIDVYALALVMWEVAWRCEATAHSDGVVPPYQLPFHDLVGDRPTLDQMKDIVVTEKQRPPIPPSWRTHEGMSVITTAIQDSWDDDSEARLTAAGIMCRLENLKDYVAPAANDLSTAPAAPTTTIATREGHILCAETHVDQAMPPPYSAEDPHPQDPAGDPPSSHTRFHFQSSLPVLRPAENGRARPLNALSRNMCNSAFLSRETARHQPAVSVRYSLILDADLSPHRPRASDTLTTSVSMELASSATQQGDRANPAASAAPVHAGVSQAVPSADSSQSQRSGVTPSSGRARESQTYGLTPNIERSGENTVDDEPPCV